MDDYAARREAEPDRPEKHPLFFSKAMQGIKRIVDRGDRFSKETQPGVRQVLRQQYLRAIPTVHADAIRAQRNQALSTLDTGLERAVEEQDEGRGLSLIGHLVDNGILSKQQGEERQVGFQTAFRAKGEQLAIDGAEMFVKAGDLDGAIGMLHDSPLSEEERAKHTRRLTKRHRVNQFAGEIESLIEQNPVEAIGRLFGGRAKNDSEDEVSLPSAQHDGLLKRAFGRHHEEKQLAFAWLNDGLDDGSIDTPEEIRETLAPLSLSEREIAPWIERLHASGPPSRMRRWELEDDIALYDPDNDPYGAQADGLRGRLALLRSERHLSESRGMMNAESDIKPASGLARKLHLQLRKLGRLVSHSRSSAPERTRIEDEFGNARRELIADLQSGKINTEAELSEKFVNASKPVWSRLIRNAQIRQFTLGKDTRAKR